MSWYDYLNPVYDAHQVFGDQVKGPPGSGTGAPPSDARLVHNPDGTATDPATGQTYAYTPPVTSPNGVSTPGQFTAVTNPTVATQVGTNANNGNTLMDKAGNYDTREQGAYDQQGQLADDLNAIAHGTGPSVAGTQLAIGEQAAANQQLAQAAGASGNNAALARTTAMNNTAGLQAQTNQQQALARATEETNAYKNLGDVTGAMAGESSTEAANKVSGANSANNIAIGGEESHEGAAQAAATHNADTTVNDVNALAGPAKAYGTAGK